LSRDGRDRNAANGAHGGAGHGRAEQHPPDQTLEGRKREQGRGDRAERALRQRLGDRVVDGRVGVEAGFQSFQVSRPQFRRDDPGKGPESSAGDAAQGTANRSATDRADRAATDRRQGLSQAIGGTPGEISGCWLLVARGRRERMHGQVAG
jgi:hypothetical protein